MRGTILQTAEQDFAAMTFILSLTIMSQFREQYRQLVAVATIAVTLFVVATVDQFLVNSLSANCGTKCAIPLCFFAGYLPASLLWQVAEWKTARATRKVKVEDDEEKDNEDDDAKENDEGIANNNRVDPQRLEKRRFAVRVGRALRQVGLLIPTYLFVDRLTTPSFLFGVLMVEARELVVPFATKAMDKMEDPTTNLGATRRERMLNGAKLAAMVFVPLNAAMATIFISFGMVIVSAFDQDEWYFRREVWIEVVVAVAVHTIFQAVAVLFVEGPLCVRLFRYAQNLRIFGGKKKVKHSRGYKKCAGEATAAKVDMQ